MDEKEIVIKKIEDKLDRFQNRDILDSSDFLTLEEQSLTKRLVESNHLLLFGGFDEAERKKVIFIPSYLEKEDAINEIFSLVEVTIPKQEKVTLSHRDYLGALMGLGIKREKVGDILVYSNGAEIICDSTITEYISTELTSVGRASVNIKIKPITEIDLGEIKIEEVTVNVPSVRLDNVISEVFKLSRKLAQEAINKGLIFVDGSENTKPDYQLKENQKIVFRGKGKVIYMGITGESKKGNKYILLKKYI